MDIKTLAKDGTEEALSPFRQFINDALAKINGDAALQASVLDLKSRLEAAQVEVKRMEGLISAHATEITNLKAAHATELETARTTAAATTLAKTGVVPVQTENATPGAQTETLESIRAQIAKETDPAKRYALAQKARELRGHADIFKN